MTNTSHEEWFFFYSFMEMDLILRKNKFLFLIILENSKEDGSFINI